MISWAIYGKRAILQEQTQINSMRVEILVEEESIKALLEMILPRICNNTKWIINQNVFIRSFEGKNHLKKELPKKSKVYAQFHEPVFMLVIQDQDSSNCVKLKQDIIELIKPSGLSNYKVRIVCKELECWYLGDLDAIEMIISASKAGKLKHKSKYKDPEKLNGKDELKKWVHPYGAIQFAHRIAPHLNLDENRSTSFNQTLSTLKDILK